MKDKNTHLGFIRDAINQLSLRSVGYKSAAIAMYTTIIPLLPKYIPKLTDISQVNITFLLLLLPAITFWFLDVHNLADIRRYREFYDLVRKKAECQIDFSMDTPERTILQLVVDHVKNQDDNKPRFRNVILDHFKNRFDRTLFGAALSSIPTLAFYAILCTTSMCFILLIYG